MNKQEKADDVRKETAKDILSSLKYWIINRYNYFAELREKNIATNHDNYLFDLGECDMANCILDIVKAKIKEYDVEVEE